MEMFQLFTPPNLSSSPVLTRDSGGYIKRCLHANLKGCTTVFLCCPFLMNYFTMNEYFLELSVCFPQSNVCIYFCLKKKDSGVCVPGLDLTRTPRLLNSA